jgi:SAM-dependent methyltransferase
VTVDWVSGFYSRTGAWWGRAEAHITERDHRRVGLLHEHAGPGPRRVLELGSGYGTTAAATAMAGHAVTAVEISDRADFTAGVARDVTPGTLTIVRDDFYRVRLDGQFDVVSYWNGFGVGSDADQRRLLQTIATTWLRPGGVALIDVYNPFVWARWDGDEEHLTPDPANGYEHELFERTSFDPVTCTAVDTWWEAGKPDDAISQVLRCYTPADLGLLLSGTGLRLATIVDGDLLHQSHEYLAVLRHAFIG